MCVMYGCDCMKYAVDDWALFIWNNYLICAALKEHGMCNKKSIWNYDSLVQQVRDWKVSEPDEGGISKRKNFPLKCARARNEKGGDEMIFLFG